MNHCRTLSTTTYEWRRPPFAKTISASSLSLRTAFCLTALCCLFLRLPMISEVPEAAASAATPTKTVAETTREFTELAAAAAGGGAGRPSGETRAPRRVARRSNARSETVKENERRERERERQRRRRQAAERRVLEERAEDDNDDGLVRYRAPGARDLAVIRRDFRWLWEYFRS